MALEKLVGGKIISYKGESFLLVEKSLEEMGDNPITRYLAEHKQNLSLDKVRKRFPGLHHVPKNAMLYFDVETTGLSGNHAIFSIGMTHLTEGINTSCLFARDYWEERAVLKYFLDLLPEHHAFFTYNGDSFDIPRLEKRIRNAHGLLHDSKSLRDFMNSAHIDLYHEMRKACPGLQDYTLRSVEKLVFGLSRRGDIASSKVPEAYQEYINGTDGEEKIARVIQHNMRDTLTLAAIFAYLCREKH